MPTVRTIVCKLQPTPEQQVEIDATLTAFASACNSIADVCRAIPSTNRVEVHHACYHNVRAEFGLSANLAVRAIARVCIALKAKERGLSSFDPTSIDYDARIFDYREADGTFSLTLLHGRHRIATVLGAFQRDALQGRKPTSATLVKRKDGRYFLHVQVKDVAPEPLVVSDVLGVDLGIINLAVDSTGEAFSGAATSRNRRRCATARKQHQRRGTKNAKRKLKRLSGKQARFQRHVNHCIAKRIVGKARALNTAIALEDLTSIRDRIEPTASTRFRRSFGNWGFYQLRSFVEYKARAAGVPVVLVDPRHTSRTCSACGHCAKGNRKSQAEFVCQHCAFSTNADLNASRNLARLGQSKLASKVSAS